MRYSSDLVLIRLPQIRASMRPAEFAKRESVDVMVGDQRVIVRIDRVAHVCFGGTRRWLRWPRCDRKTVTLGFEMISYLFGCKTCMKWRSRSPTVIAPHLRQAAGDPARTVTPTSPGRR